jgi:hypothetical protein
MMRAPGPGGFETTVSITIVCHSWRLRSPSRSCTRARALAAPQGARTCILYTLDQIQIQS